MNRDVSQIVKMILAPFLLGVIITAIVFMLFSMNKSNDSTTKKSSDSSYSKVNSDKYEEQLVNDFVTGYTNYNSLNERNENVKGYVSNSVKKEFGFNEKAPSNINLKMESKSIKVWYGKPNSHKYLVMVKDSLNGDEKTDVLELHVSTKNNKPIIDKISLPISSADTSKYGN